MVDPIIQNRIQTLSPIYKDFVLSDFAENAANVFGVRFDFGEDNIIILENGIAMYLLFFMNKNELIEYVKTDCNLQKDDAVLLIEAILNELPDSMIKGIEETYLAFKQAGEQADLIEESDIDAKTPPTANSEKAPIPQPGITVKPEEPIVPSDKVATLRDLPERPKKEIPTGKMVGLAQESAESTIKGMRTMRGDINRLRGPENEGEGNGSKFTKPFPGK